MISAVDTNVLLDVLLPDEAYYDASRETLDRAYAEGSLIICEVVYAELACQFRSSDELGAFLSDVGIRLEYSTREALQEAGSAWRDCTSRRGDHLQCPSCGGFREVTCQRCSVALKSRQHIVSAFIVGGHALAQADRLLSRDRGFYRTYFPALRLND